MWLFELSLVPKISKTLRTIYLMDRNPILIFVTNLRTGRMSAEVACLVAFVSAVYSTDKSNTRSLTGIPASAGVSTSVPIFPQANSAETDSSRWGFVKFFVVHKRLFSGS